MGVRKLLACSEANEEARTGHEECGFREAGGIVLDGWRRDGMRGNGCRNSRAGSVEVEEEEARCEWESWKMRWKLLWSFGEGVISRGLSSSIEHLVAHKKYEKEMFGRCRP